MRDFTTGVNPFGSLAPQSGGNQWQLIGRGAVSSCRMAINHLCRVEKHPLGFVPADAAIRDRDAVLERNALHPSLLARKQVALDHSPQNGLLPTNEILYYLGEDRSLLGMILS